MSIKRLAHVILFGGVIALGGCGGGGDRSTTGDSGGTDYSGSTSQATVRDSNVQPVSKSAAEGAKQTILQYQADDSGFGGYASSSSSVEKLLAYVDKTVLDRKLIASSTGTFQPQASQSLPGACGGTATVTASADGTSATITYSNYCVNSSDNTGQIVANGVVSYTYSADGSSRVVYDNFTMTYGGESHRLDMTVECDASYNCTYSSDFRGSDGRVYRTQNVSVYQNHSGNYVIDARVYDPSHGYVDISSTGLSVCDNGNIANGTISVSDSSGEVLSITFQGDCSTMTVTYNNVSSTYQQ